MNMRVAVAADPLLPNLQKIDHIVILMLENRSFDMRGYLSCSEGRRNLADDRKQKFVDRAKSYLGRPFDFWNFNLADARGFYCSKLVWLSHFKATRTSLDGGPAERFLWFSPKQLWNLHRTGKIVRINAPRNYTY